jgi:hypothetical protein
MGATDKRQGLKDGVGEVTSDMLPIIPAAKDHTGRNNKPRRSGV